MKQKLHKFTRLILGSRDPRIIFSIFLVLAAFVTRDKDYKSRKNTTVAWSLIFLLIVTFFAYAELYPHYNSGWKKLQQEYPLNIELEYQEKQVLVSIVKPDQQHKKNQYYVKIRLDDKGFAFKPLRYASENLRSGVTLTHKPIFIPWTAIKICEKIDYPDPYDKIGIDSIRLTIDKLQIKIQLKIWEFLKPECEKRSIQIHEN